MSKWLIGGRANTFLKILTHVVKLASGMVFQDICLPAMQRSMFPDRLYNGGFISLFFLLPVRWMLNIIFFWCFYFLFRVYFFFKYPPIIEEQLSLLWSVLLEKEVFS